MLVCFVLSESSSHHTECVSTRVPEVRPRPDQFRVRDGNPQREFKLVIVTCWSHHVTRQGAAPGPDLIISYHELVRATLLMGSLGRNDPTSS